MLAEAGKRSLGRDRDVAAMIRFLLRFLGLLCLAGAFILVIYDGTKSIAANRIYFTTVRTLWELLNVSSLAQMRPLLSPYANGVLWDPALVTVLAWPAWSLLGCVGILFILLGRKKKPLIGYAR
jgi:hypothetical protein